MAKLARMLPTFAQALWSAAACSLALPQEAAPIRFLDASQSNLPPRDSVPRNSMDIEAADLDKDGDLDLVVAQEFLANLVLRNVGAGRFEVWDLLPSLDAFLAKSGAPGHDSEDIAVADFNGDGLLDIVFVSEDDVKLGRKDVHEFYRGAAGGKMERVLGLLPDSEANAIAYADWNRDGHVDLLLAGAGQDRLLTNDGKGAFKDETQARLPREAATTQDAEFFDADGDLDLDLVLAFEGGHALWIQQDGIFHDRTKAALPAPEFVEARKVAAVDIDRDGDLDLYFSHVGWMGRVPQDRLYKNDGKGQFTDATTECLGAESGTTADARFADFDGDGDLDLVRVNLGPLEILTNDGQGRFTDVTKAALPEAISGPGLGVEIADFDRDGALDLYVGYLAGPKKDPGAFDRLLLGVKPK